MANEILSAKLNELDREFERLRSRIHLGEEEDRGRIERELILLRRECTRNEQELRSRMALSRAQTVGRISRVYSRVEQVIKEAKLEVSGNKNAEEWLNALSAEEKALLAEYALDFAMQAANRALLVAMEAIEGQLAQQEREEE